MPLRVPRKTDLSKRLRALREKRGLTQKELAMRSGVTVAAMIESGRIGEPQYKTIVALAMALGVTPEDLMGSTSAMPRALAEFLASPPGQTATPDEIDHLRRMAASGRRPTQATYYLALQAFRSMEPANNNEEG